MRGSRKRAPYFFKVQVILLGTAAGGGFPQWNCWCPTCRIARREPARARPRSQSSAAVSADGRRWFLLNASPDVHAQLATIVGDLGWRVNVSPATFEQVHLSLLTGLLGNVGLKALDADFREPPYAGARGIKFHVWPGSGLGKKAGRWVMAAELVETSRLFARTIANIEPSWLERIGAQVRQPHRRRTETTGQLLGQTQSYIRCFAVHHHRGGTLGDK